MGANGGGGLVPASSTKTITTAEFISSLLNVLKDIRLLWIANTVDTTTSTDKSRHAKTLTWSKSLATFDVPPLTLGAGAKVNFDGTDEEGDVPDADNLSFGDGANDEAFSIIAVFNADVIASKVVVAKRDQTTGTTQQEYALYTDSGGDLTFSIWDDGASAANIGRKRDTALTADKWYLAVATYDGSRSISGIKLYLNGVRVDDADVSSGTYVAMENKDDAVRIAHWLDTSTAVANLFNGDISLVAVVGKELTIDEQWLIKGSIEDYHGITLT